MTTETGPPAPSQNAHDRDVPACPYVGLDPFDEKDAAYFFGRERDSDLIVANLTAWRLTLLYAPSGVGKSSVLRAGVLPRLHHIDDDSSDTPGVSGAAVVYVRTWRDVSLESLAVEVSAAVSKVTSASPGKTGPAEIGATERGTSEPKKLTVPWLSDVLRQSRVSMIYLIFDQFEEYFFYHPSDSGEEGLTAELGRILSARDLPVHVLLSIREDALAGLDRFEGRVPHLFDNYFRLEHLSRDAARAAIEGPLDRYNRVVPPDRRMSIEPELIETLLDQVRTGRVRVVPEGTAPEGFASDGPASDDRGDIETPYLQLVLTRLWDSERATGSSSLRQSTLGKLGGAQTIVQTHLDNVMAGLSPAQRDIAAAVFRHLVTKSGTKIALTAEDIANQSELPVPVNTVRDLLETLSAGPQRILRPVPPAVGVAEPSRYEIFHDVMGPAVIDWRRRYMERRQQEQTIRRLLRRVLLTVAVMVAVMLLVVGVVVYINYREAQQQQQQTFLAQAAAALVDSPERSLRRAVDAYQVNANEQTRSAVLAAASSPRSHVIAGPNLMPHPMTVIGMKSTPDSRHVVAYDAHGSIRVLNDNGAVERQVQASGLRGTVIPGEWAAAVNPDASRVALGTDQGMVAVIDTVTGRHLDIESEGGVPRTVTWIGSAANGLVLVVFKSGLAATYSPDTGQQVARFPGVVDAVALADEQHLVTSGPDKKLAVWDARTGTKSAESSTLSSAAESLTPYGQSVVGLLGGAQPSIVVWNLKAGQDPVQYPVDGANQVQKVVVNERAQTIMIAQGTGVRTYSLVDGSLRGSLPAQADMVTDVATSPDGQWVTTANTDGRILVWFPGHGQSPIASTYRLLAHRGKVTQVSYLRAGTVVMSVGIDGTLRRWELPPVPRFEQRGNGVTHMDFSRDSRDGSWLATASQDGHVFILDPHDLSKPPVALAPVSAGTPLKTVLFDPTDPHRILTLTQRGRAPERWRWGDDGKSERLPPYETPPLPASEYLVSLALSPDGTMVAAGDTLGGDHFWDARTGKLHPDRELRGTRPTFGPSGQLLATVDQDGVRLWKLGTAEPPALLPHPNARSVDFSPSGEYLVSTARDDTVNIWTRDGTHHRELAVHGRLSSSPSFSRDGGLVAVGTAGGQVEIWDVRSGMTVMLDRHHSAPIGNVIFLPGDRSRLISASDDTTLAQFSCPACTDPDRVIREAVEWARTNPE